MSSSASKICSGGRYMCCSLPGVGTSSNVTLRALRGTSKSCMRWRGVARGAVGREVAPCAGVEVRRAAVRWWPCACGGVASMLDPRSRQW